MSQLSFRDLGVSYFLPDGRTNVAVRDVNLEAQPGEFLCFVGPSGCGKTTLLRVAAGLLAPTTGEVQLNGIPIRGPGRERCMVFQEYALFPWYTALDNVAYGLKLMGEPKEERRRAAGELLRPSRVDGLRKLLSGRALRRHAPARCNRAGVGCRP